MRKGADMNRQYKPRKPMQKPRSAKPCTREAEIDRCQKEFHLTYGRSIETFLKQHAYA